MGLNLYIWSFFFFLILCFAVISLVNNVFVAIIGAAGRRCWHCTVVQSPETVGVPLRGPEISALNKELCVWLAWFTGNTSPDQCVWPGPATRWASRRLRQMAGLWDAEWRETIPVCLSSKGAVVLDRGGGGAPELFFTSNMAAFWLLLLYR